MRVCRQDATSGFQKRQGGPTTEAEQILEKGLEIARSIASKGPVAVRLTKQIVQRGQDLDLANACQQEAYAFGLCCATEDQKEGMKAFLEKRPAKFVGR